MYLIFLHGTNNCVIKWSCAGGQSRNSSQLGAIKQLDYDSSKATHVTAIVFILCYMARASREK